MLKKEVSRFSFEHPQDLTEIVGFSVFGFPVAFLKTLRYLRYRVGGNDLSRLRRRGMLRFSVALASATRSLHWAAVAEGLSRDTTRQIGRSFNVRTSPVESGRITAIPDATAASRFNVFARGHRP